jgi:transcriptional regulator with XRE-family HTH domain
MQHSPHHAENIDKQSPTQQAAEKAISRAIGKELRLAREARGWSRAQFVALLPSGICDRTLLSYEHGTRHLTALRLVELCGALGVAAPTLFSQALQRAQLELANLVLRVDLRFLLNDRSDKFRPLVQWARNKLNKYPDGIVEVSPSSVEDIATYAGFSIDELASYLARFTPEIDDYADTGDTGAAGEPR